MSRPLKMALSVVTMTALSVGASALRAQPGTVAAKDSLQKDSLQKDSVPKIPEIDKVRTPQSPAFVILGIAPTTIERPATPAKLAISLANSFSSGNQAVLPRNYALEVAPYWLANHPNLRASMMEDDFGKRNPRAGTMAGRVAQNILQTFTIGIAAADSAFKTSATPATDTSIFRLGFSAHVSPLRGHWAEGCLATVEKALTKVATMIAVPLATWIAAHPTADKDAIEAENQRLLAEATGNDLATKDSTGTCLSAYRGLTLDLAAAGVGRFDAQRFDGGAMSAYAFWATLGYTWDDSRGILAVARSGKEGSAGKRLAASYTDFGVRAVLPHDEWALSFEWVSRRVAVADSTNSYWRVTGGFDYKLSDALWLNTAFGRDYQAKKANSLIALANLQWSFGTKSLLAPGEER